MRTFILSIVFLFVMASMYALMAGAIAVVMPATVYAEVAGNPFFTAFGGIVSLGLAIGSVDELHKKLP